MFILRLACLAFVMYLYCHGKYYQILRNNPGLTLYLWNKFLNEPFFLKKKTCEDGFLKIPCEDAFHLARIIFLARMVSCEEETLARMVSFLARMKSLRGWNPCEDEILARMVLTRMVSCEDGFKILLVSNFFFQFLSFGKVCLGYRVR